MSRDVGAARESRRKDLVRTYLPRPFYERIPRQDRAWRGRTILMLWGLGYALEHAWALGMTDDDDQVGFYRDAVAQLDDRRLIDLLVATEATRGDGQHLAFVSFGLIVEGDGDGGQ